MTIVSVRISEREKKELLKYGKLSESLREGLRLYLNQRKSEKLLRELKALQARNSVKTSTKTDTRLIKEDRTR